MGIATKRTSSPTIAQLMNESEIAYEVQQLENAKLLDAFKEKRLKSKDAIKRAIRLKKEAEKKAE